jgi:hypothetical protein
LILTLFDGVDVVDLVDIRGVGVDDVGLVSVGVGRRVSLQIFPYPYFYGWTAVVHLLCYNQIKKP